MNIKLLDELVLLSKNEEFDVEMLLTKHRKPVYQPKIAALIMDMVTERQPFHQISLALYQIGVKNSYGEPLSLQTIKVVIERLQEIYPHYNN